MRIVHVSDCYLPRMGGIENQVHDLAARQSQRGEAVHVLTATAAAEGNGGLSRYRVTRTEDTGVRVHRLATPVTFGVPIHPRGYWLLRRALAKLRPDVVHVHAGLISPFAWDGARAAKALGLPMVITWHSRIDGAETAIGIGAKLTGWSHTDFVASSCSRPAAARVAAAIGHDDVAVLPNGFDLQPWQAAATRPIPSSRPGTLRVVAAQRFAPRKRTVALLRAVAGAHQRLGLSNGAGRIQLTLAGSGVQQRLVERTIQDLSLPSVVTLLGRVPRQVLPTIYRSQDVFLSSAILENGGGAALEARVAGLAVVARSGNGIADHLTSGTHGILADSDAGLADALVQLARQPSLLEAMRATNRASSPHISWAYVLERADELYRRAVSQRRSAAANI
ncbi:MAG: glycosyltransferase family 4 protein [Beutenbergiaceae bacterium]